MWVFFALAASVLWGITYVLNEQIYKYISISMSLLITSIVSTIIFFALALTQKTFGTDVQMIMESRPLQKLLVADIIVFVMAEFAIAFSITHKNATIAGLIEISYPVFIALFGYILFRQNTIGEGTIAGALLIFSGIFIVYHFNQ